MISETKKYQLQDLIENIEAVDKMIKRHSPNPSKFMIEQYEAKKQKLLGYLIDELVDSKFRSPYSFRLIQLALKRYYPHLMKSDKKSSQNKHYKELKGLESVLAT